MIATVKGLGEHERERVFTGPARSGEDQRMGKPPGADPFTQMGDGCGIANKIMKAHVLEDTALPVGGAEHTRAWKIQRGMAFTRIPFLGRSVIFGCSSMV